MNNKGTEEFLVETKAPSKATLLTTSSCKIRPHFKEANTANCHGQLMLLDTSSNTTTPKSADKFPEQCSLSIMEAEPLTQNGQD